MWFWPPHCSQVGFNVTSTHVILALGPLHLMLATWPCSLCRKPWYTLEAACGVRARAGRIWHRPWCPIMDRSGA